VLRLVLTLPNAFRRGVTDDTAADFDPEKKKAAMLGLAQKWLGKRCLAGWPYPFRATIVSILTETSTFKVFKRSCFEHAKQN